MFINISYIKDISASEFQNFLINDFMEAAID